MCVLSSHRAFRDEEAASSWLSLGQKVIENMVNMSLTEPNIWYWNIMLRPSCFSRSCRGNGICQCENHVTPKTEGIQSVSRPLPLVGPQPQNSEERISWRRDPFPRGWKKSLETAWSSPSRMWGPILTELSLAGKAISQLPSHTLIQGPSTQCDLILPWSSHPC